MASQVPPQVPVRGATDYLGALGPAIVGVSVSLCAFATILVALRVYTYFFVVRNKGGWALLWRELCHESFLRETFADRPCSKTSRTEIAPREVVISTA